MHFKIFHILYTFTMIFISGRNSDISVMSSVFIFIS